MARIRSAALVVGALVPIVLALVVLTAPLGFGRKLPERFDPPLHGAQVEIGVAYGVETWCLFPIEVAGQWWAFPTGAIEPPPVEIPPFPESLWARSPGNPYPVPGVLIFSSPNHAVFRADSDGSQFTMIAHRHNPMDGDGCM
jgi:hypothetical protein